MKFKHLLIILIILLAIGLILIDSSSEAKTKITQTFEQEVYENGTIEAYFCPQDDCNRVISETVLEADEVNCAFYDLNDDAVFSALIEKNAGLIIHYENFETSYEGFAFSRQTDGLMHDKFCILDEKKIMTGSHNPTQNENKDNLLIIESSYLAENYNLEFSKLMNYPAPEKPKTKNTKIIFNGYELENYFCPQDDCQKEILDELVAAEKSIYFLTYTFTDKTIAGVLTAKNAEGLEVRGAIESYQGKTYWVYPQLLQGNVSVVLDEESVLQHNKVFIIDNKTVITGSFNPTKAADTKNDENIIIIRQPEIVQEYLSEFERLYAEFKK